MNPMSRVAPLLGSTFQWGYVVRDLEAAMRHWNEVLKVGPFIRVADFGKLDCRYHGRPTDVRLSVAFSYIGDVQIELIHQLNDAPSPYLDFLKSGREGLQHLGFWVDDFDGAQRQLEAGGFERVYTVLLPGASRPTCYYEGRHMGAMTELCEATPQKALLYGAMKSLVQNWDGTNPVRRYANITEFAAEQKVPSLIAAT